LEYFLHEIDGDNFASNIVSDLVPKQIDGRLLWWPGNVEVVSKLSPLFPICHDFLRVCQFFSPLTINRSASAVMFAHAGKFSKIM